MAARTIQSTIRSALSRSRNTINFKPPPLSSSISSRSTPTPNHQSHHPPHLSELNQPQQIRTRRPRTRTKPKSEEELEAERLEQQELLTSKLEQSFKPPKILFENEKVVVIDKPAGCALQADVGSEPYIRWKLIMRYLQDRRGIQLHIVHRLDKSATGPLILAKSSTASRTLSTQFKNASVKKTYYAAIQFLGDRIGPIQDAKLAGTIECRMRNRNDKMVIAEANRTGLDCKQATTGWELVTATSNHAIVRLRPKTGRKHQLRLHCSRFLAGPIVGDYKYDFRYLSHQSEKAIHDFLNREAPGRILLHCSEIEFKLYRKETPREYTVNVQSPIHDDFRIVCDQLDLSTTAIQ
ncbi:hypothetical protein Pst134EA_008953 [Puccinia striiformis f. sp. tritici]|uniref:hypothetical protein n=1 Tax=Puccinia striiformis f. sp. tritici TaxID=168172 RepID=UPI002007DEEB|nr:hypothetical protein Pst134EA_008953 [Puccinia striiformis f. sp. tritici]KAH9468413.1 hypothetical protein Pst134EA_008953 [Puccinia striiformis f. sp. tritici]